MPFRRVAGPPPARHRRPGRPVLPGRAAAARRPGAAGRRARRGARRAPRGAEPARGTGRRARPVPVSPAVRVTAGRPVSRSLAAAGAGGRGVLAPEGGAVLQDGVDLPPLIAGGTGDPELVLAGIAA